MALLSNMTEMLAQAWVDGCKWTEEMREIPAEGATDEDIQRFMRTYILGPSWDARGKAGHWNEDPRWEWVFFRPLVGAHCRAINQCANGGFVYCNGSTSSRHPEFEPKDMMGGRTWDNDMGRWEKCDR